MSRRWTISGRPTLEEVERQDLLKVLAETDWAATTSAWHPDEENKFRGAARLSMRDEESDAVMKGDK